MKLNNRFIFGILSLLLAAVIAFVALPTIARQTNGKEEIVRITQPVLKGEQISSENAEVVEVGGYNLPSNIAHLLSDVNGLYATADLAVGDYSHRSMCVCLGSPVPPHQMEPTDGLCNLPANAH